MKKGLLLSLSLLFSVFYIFAQNTKDIKDLFIEAEEHLLYEEYDQALPKYLELIERGLENANTYFSVGICYMNMPGQVRNAIPYLEKATQNVSSNYKEGNYKEESAPEEAWFYLAKAYRVTNSFDKAIEAYKKFKSTLSPSDIYYNDFADLQIKSCENARKFMQNPINFITTQAPFNEDGENYQAAVSGNGEHVAFTAFQEVRDPYTQETNYFEIVYYSKFDGHEWSKPKDITFDIESDGYLSSLALNYEGDYMLLYRDDYGNGNIYASFRDGNKWGKAERLAKQINTRENETSASISKDGNTLYFVSDRIGGIGGKDIYMSEKDKKGRWGTAVNLGETINTVFEEETPFIAEDGKTLYFASEAHNSMGGYDIFKSVRDDNGNWSEPQNLGYPLNTANDDLFYVPMGDGTSAYMTRLPEGESNTKIFKIDYPQTQRVVDVLADNNNINDDLNLLDNTNNNTTGTDQQQVYVPETETPTINENPGLTTIVVPSEYELKGRLTLDDNKDLNNSFYLHVLKPDGEVVAALSPDIATGEFSTKIKHGSYTVQASGNGYETAEKSIFISENQQSPEVLTFLSLKPKEVSSGQYYTIKSILFDYSSDILDYNAQVEIEKLAQLMTKYPSLYIEVVGNTDSHGTDEYNKNLSIRRARAVVEYLTSKGVGSDRFVTKGAGKENFIAINENPDGSDNPEGRKLNRRVDMKVIKSGGDNVSFENIYVPDELLYKDQLTYTIMLMESPKVLDPSYFLKAGSAVSNVWMFQSEGGYLYTVGQFKHKADALDVMKVVVDAGFPDAKIISSFEYKELVEKSSNFYKTKMSSTDNNVYSIQLLALKEPRISKSFKGLADVREVHCDDGMYRYIYGEYIGKVSAKQALEDAIDKGYYDAFIIEKSKYYKPKQ